LILSPADRRWCRRLLAAGLLFALLYPNLSGARTVLTTGWHREHIRDLVTTLAAERRPGEGLYVNEDAEPAFRYYWFRNGRDLDAEEVVWGERHRASPELHAAQVSKLRYTAFWALLTHISPTEATVLRELILERYDCDRSWVVGDARLDFYRLKPAAPTAP